MSEFIRYLFCFTPYIIINLLLYNILFNLYNNSYNIELVVLLLCD